MTAKMYRSKPKYVEAISVDDALELAHSHRWDAMPGWLRGISPTAPAAAVFTLDHVSILTLEGHMRADRGDMIVRGTRGELYPCKPGPFSDSYEEVTE